MKTIEKYIQFAIDNGYKPKGLIYYHKNEVKEYIIIQEGIELDGELNLGVNFNNNVDGIFLYDKYFNVYYGLKDEITSKEFIEAIVRGIIKEGDFERKVIENNFGNLVRIEYRLKGFPQFIKYDNNCNEDIYGTMYRKENPNYNDIITIEQAIAIREDSLDYFIKNLLG